MVFQQPNPFPMSIFDNVAFALREQSRKRPRRRELAVVMVTHNLAQARRVADKVAFMYLGDLVEYGTARQVFEEPRAERTRDYVRGAFG